MKKKPQTSKAAAEKVVKNIRRKTRQTYSAEEKIRIVLAGFRGAESISALCRLWPFRSCARCRRRLFGNESI
jgi:transposase